MAKKKLSASALKAQQEYFDKMGIYQTAPVKKKKAVIAEIKGPEIKAINLGLNGSLKSFGIYISLINKVGPLMYMTDREIVEKCLSHYNDALNYIIKLEIVDGNLNLSMYNYLASLSMHHGLCYFARHKLNVDICQHWFITEFQFEPDGFWHITPKDCRTSKQIIDSISYRVERLQEILNSMQ